MFRTFEMPYSESAAGFGTKGLSGFCTLITKRSQINPNEAAV